MAFPAGPASHSCALSPTRSAVRQRPSAGLRMTPFRSNRCLVHCSGLSSMAIGRGKPLPAPQRDGRDRAATVSAEHVIQRPPPVSSALYRPFEERTRTARYRLNHTRTTEAGIQLRAHQAAAGPTWAEPAPGPRARARPNSQGGPFRQSASDRCKPSRKPTLQNTTRS